MEMPQVNDVVCVSSSQFSAAPKVSVVMSVYNNEQYLGEAIDSILNQDFDDFEFVIVDDGSVEPARSILEQYARSSDKITLIRQTNRGISCARNAGLKYSRGQYVAVMDSDDIALPQRLAIQSRYLDANQDVSVVGSGYYSISIDGSLVNIERPVTNSLLVESYLLSFFSLHHPTMMFRKDVMQAVGGYDETAGACEDYDLTLRVLFAGYRITNLPSFLMKWRHTPTGETFGKSTYQAECGSAFRNRSLNQLNDLKSYEYLDCVIKEFPAGSEFDEKIAQVKVAGFNEPVNVWLDAAESRQDLSLLEVAAVRFLNAPLDKYSRYSDVLKADEKNWLSGVVTSLGCVPAVADQPLNSVDFRESFGVMGLSVLLPIGKDMRDYEQRFANVIKQLENVVEVLVYQDQPQAADVSFDIMPEGVQFLGKCSHYDALVSAKGEFISVLDEGVRWYDGFISESVTALKSNPSVDAVYAAAGGVDVDADGVEIIISDPTIPGRLTQNAVAGQGRVYGAGFVVRRDACSSLYLQPQEMGDALFWAIGRELLACKEVEVLARVNGCYNPHNLNRGAFYHSLVWILDWYYRSCFGLIPFATTNDHRVVGDSDTARQVSDLWSAGVFRVYWGNLPQVREFYSEFVEFPINYPIFKSIMLSGGLVAGVKACLAHKRANWVIPLLGYYILNKFKKV